MFYIHVEILRRGSARTWFAMVIADSSMITRMSHDVRAKVCRRIYDVNVCKNQWWAPNNRSVEFQRVGKTIFIKSKMLLFLYTLIISIQIFKSLTFFYQVIIFLTHPLIGIPSTAPPYDPARARVARRDLSRGGAHHLQIPWQDGYVTPSTRP